MDVVLQALDTVNEMFSQVRERGELTPAHPDLLAALARLAQPARPMRKWARLPLSSRLRFRSKTLQK